MQQKIKLIKIFTRLLIVVLMAHVPLAADDSGKIDVILQEYISGYEQATTVENKAHFLQKIIVETTYSDLNMSLTYLEALKELSDSSGSYIARIRYYNVKGILSHIQEQPVDSVQFWFDKGLEVIKTFKIHDLELNMTLYNNKAIAYEEKGMFNYSIKQYTAGLDALKNSNETNYEYETLFYSNISNMLMRSKQYGEAWNHIVKAEEKDKIREKIIGKRSGYYEFIMSVKGEILYLLGRYDEAEDAFEQLAAYDNKLNLVNNHGQIILGQTYAKNGKIELARATVLEALQDAKKLDIGIANLVRANLTMAQLELNENNATTSLEYLDNIFKLYESSKERPDAVLVYKTIATALEQSGRFKESLFYTKEYQNQLDTEKEKENNLKYGELEQQFSNIEKQYEINELEIKQELQGSRISMLIVAFTLSLLTMIFIYVMYVKKEEHNKTLIKINKEITLAKDIAIGAAKAKENFLSTMSHEMRTPMNAVIGITNILLDEKPKQDQIEHLKNLKFSGESLLNIINEVLDFSKIEASKLEIVKREFNLQILLDKMVSSVRHGKVNPKVKLFQDQQLQDLHHTVSGDQNRIIQILTNLLGNSIKFTDEGHIVMRSRIHESTDNYVCVKFQVEDSGIGIPADKLQSIFESFSQVNGEINRVHQGTGLGLAITKRLVELQDGKIEVESKEGRGTTFSFILKFERVNLIVHTPVEETKTQIFQSGIEGRKILLVEDNRLNQIVALKVLEKFKVETTLAQNGEEALKMVMAEDYDLVLMDIHMPVMDGIESTIKIRALSDITKSQIPIIALSADAYSDKVKVAEDCGMNDYLSKPFKPQELFEKIKSNINNSKVKVR